MKTTKKKGFKPESNNLTSITSPGQAQSLCRAAAARANGVPYETRRTTIAHEDYVPPHMRAGTDMLSAAYTARMEATEAFNRAQRSVAELKALRSNPPQPDGPKNPQDA